MLQGCRASDKFLLKIYSIGQEPERGNTHNRDKRSKIKKSVTVSGRPIPATSSGGAHLV